MQEKKKKKKNERKKGITIYKYFDENDTNKEISEYFWQVLHLRRLIV